MHEASIAAPLLRLVLDELKKHESTLEGPLRVTRVRIRAGLLVAVEPATLQGCFALMAEGTPAEGAELFVETLPMRGRCLSCGQEAETPARSFACPACGAAEVAWAGGNELFIESLSCAHVTRRRE